VHGIELRDDDLVVGFCIANRPAVLTVCENGYGKRTPLEDYRLQGRAGYGIINIKTEGRNGNVVDVSCVSDEDEILLISSANKAIRMPVKDVSVMGRSTQGVRLMKLDEGEKIVAIEHLAKEDANNGNGSLHSSSALQNQLPAQASAGNAKDNIKKEEDKKA